MNQDNNIKSQQIKKLPDNLINQIAAGEVVERPASVIKELLENSIDAGATSITVELKKGGKELIKIVDNGVGLDKSQFDLVFERHATSKIASIDDLNSNLNLGFRGEALAAISSVSQIEFASNGHLINSDGKLKAKSMPNGTQVTVENLFYNVPVRLKFLKTDATEYTKCLEIVESYALCHPEVHFKLIHNQKIVFDYPKANTKEDRIRAVLGQDFSQKLLPISYSGTEISLLGFIGKPETAKDRAYNQYIFVNGRPLEAQYFNHAVKNGFGSLIFPSEKPTFLIWLQLDPKDVDMNVHPRKLEARFHFQGIIYNVILKAVKNALEKTSLAKTVELSRDSVENFLPKKDYTPSNSYNNTYNPQSFTFAEPKNTPFPANSFQNPSNNLITSESAHSKSEPSLRPLCQINNSYIVCESKEGVIFIDQHAAHERVMYQKLKKVRQNQNQNTQPLLIPIQLELSISQIETFKNASSVLNSIGFDIQDFGQNSIVVNAIPAKFSANDIESLVFGLFQDLSEGVDFSKLEEIEDIVINYAACRGAIKFGQKLAFAEMEALIYEMDAIQNLKYSCPHGRPTTITISYDELEKQFKRK
jgi:DNA mismatch repair protein MutL